MTTRWDEAGNDRAVELERELMMGERYFKPLRRAGARMFSHDNTSASARRVVNMLLNNDPAPLQMQIELARPGATIEQTAAGSQLNTDLDAIAKKHNAEMKKVREEMEEAAKAKDQAWQKELNDELAMLREDAKRNAESKEQLRQLPYVPLYQLIHDLTKVVLWKFESRCVWEGDPCRRGRSQTSRFTTRHARRR